MYIQHSVKIWLAVEHSHKILPADWFIAAIRDKARSVMPALLFSVNGLESFHTRPQNGVLQCLALLHQYYFSICINKWYICEISCSLNTNLWQVCPAAEDFEHGIWYYYLHSAALPLKTERNKHCQSTYTARDEWQTRPIVNKLIVRRNVRRIEVFLINLRNKYCWVFVRFLSNPSINAIVGQSESHR